MIAMVGMAPRREGLDDAEFSRLWAGRHADLVRLLPSLEAYVQHHAPPGHPHPGFDCFAELHYRDIHELKSSFRSDEYRLGVAPDEDRLVDRARMQGMRAEIEHDSAGNPEAAVVLLHSATPSGPALPGSRRLLALAGDRSGIAAIDVVGRVSLAAAIAEVTGRLHEAGITAFVSVPVRQL